MTKVRKRRLQPTYKGAQGEFVALGLLKKRGFEILRVGSSMTPFDLIAKKGNKTFAINVKYGSSFLLTASNLKKLLRLDPDYIPAFFLINQKASYFIPVEEVWEGGDYATLDEATHLKLSELQVQLQSGKQPNPNL